MEWVPFRLYAGHIINLLVSGKSHFSIYFCRFVRIYTQSELWTDRKQQDYTETIEKVTQCLGTTVISRFSCSTFWEVTNKYFTGKKQLSNLLVCWQGRIVVYHLSVTIYNCFDLRFVVYSNWKQKPEKGWNESQRLLFDSCKLLYFCPPISNTFPFF